MNQENKNKFVITDPSTNEPMGFNSMDETLNYIQYKRLWNVLKSKYLKNVDELK